MFTEPRLDERSEQPCVGIRTQVPMRQLSTAIPELTDEVLAWLDKQGVAPAGPSYVRYHVIDMSGKLDVEMGFPVAEAQAGDDRVTAGVLPKGRYASLVYTGVQNGIKGNGALLEWGKKQGLVWDTYESDRGDGFGARYESLLTNPDAETDMSKWETEVAIRLADGEPH